MYIQELELVNYKNISQLSLNFSDGINCFVGNNGVGKTNILDAIYYLSFCKSYFSLPDTQNIYHNEKFMLIHGLYNKEGSEEDIFCAYKKGKKKIFKRNNEEYKRLSEHIGLIPLVMSTPSDNNIISGSNEERRKFIDGVISQWDKNYLNSLIKYNRAIIQRNKILKEVNLDMNLLDVWDSSIVSLGESIHKKRAEFVKTIIPFFQKYYDYISLGKEKVSLKYKSQLNDNNFAKLLRDSFQRDRLMQYTTVGVHRDNLEFMLEDYPASKIASQGQKKTYLTALKLSQFDYIESICNVKPILLLDDLFDKLDAVRVEQIVRLVSGNNFGQIFISDTNKDHLDLMLADVLTDYKLFLVDEGGLLNEKK